jgi:hypothetical protein
MRPVSRRRFIHFAALGGLGALPFPVAFAAKHDTADDAPSPPLTTLIRHPLLVRSLYRVGVSHEYSPDGAAGSNRNGYQWIEEQRQGAEWIVRGYAQNRDEWMKLGWTELDWGLARQKSDGGFDSKDPFHSTSLYLEALARACIIDPQRATRQRLDGLARGMQWLMRPATEQKHVASNAPYTHRRYILAAAFGEAAAATGEQGFARRGVAWAREGLAMQQSDGTNPEKGGYDAGYQMVGVLMALRYLPVCGDPALRADLRAMIRKAVPPELARQSADGSIDGGGSTRIGLEHARSGKTKGVPYHEVMQALVYAAQSLPEPRWLAPAQKIAQAQCWLK